MNFTVNFSNLNIGIESIYKYSYDFCRDYLTDADPDFTVSTTEKKIQAEMDSVSFNPPRDYAESICIFREIAEELPKYSRCVFHGAVIEYKGRGYLFTAPSGTGKTTHIRLWQKYIGDAVKIVNGDKPIIHISPNGVTAYATPYAGKEGYHNHSSVSLNGIILMKRAKENRMEKVNPSEYLAEIMPQIYRPFDTFGVIKTLELLNTILSTVPLYVLYCNISEDAVKTSFEELTKEEYKKE